MTLDLHRHVRRSIRLRGYDHAQAGTYFVTICTRDHAGLFGDVVDGEMRVNDVGRLVKDEWLRTGTMRPHVRVIPQEFVVMPNHVHGIVWLSDIAGDDVSPGRPQVAPTQNVMRMDRAIRRGDFGATAGRPYGWSPTPSNDARTAVDVTNIVGRCDRPAGPPRRSLAAILAGFKAASTKRVDVECAMPGISIWQRGYYEHIIRHDESLDDIRRYIAENPVRWAFDRENPSRRVRGERW